MQVLDADAFVAKIEKITEHLKNEMMIVQAEQEEYANANRMPPFRYEERDMVFLNAENVTRARFSVKLDARNIGFYKIEKIKFSLICQLELSSSLRIFPLFHVNLLIRIVIDSMPTQRHQPRPPVVGADGVENWYVDAILDSRINRRRRNLLEYLVQ